MFLIRFWLIFFAGAVLLSGQTILTLSVSKRIQKPINGDRLVWLEPNKAYKVVGLYDQTRPLLQTDYGVAKGGYEKNYALESGGEYFPNSRVALKNQKCDFSAEGGGCAEYSATIVSAPKGIYAIFQVYADGVPYKNMVLPPTRPDFIFLIVNIAGILGKKITYEVHYYVAGKEVPILSLD